MKEFLGVPTIVEEAREIAKAKAAKSGKPGKKPGMIWILTVLITFGLLLLSEIMAGGGALICEFIYVLLAKVTSLPMPIPETTAMALNLYMLIIVTLTYVLYTKFIEGRPIRTIGFVKKGALVQYLIGMVVGFGIFSLAILIAWLAGAIEISLSENINVLSLLFVFGGWLIQGMEEEVCCRGFMLTSMARRYSVPIAVFANSLFFAALHLFNDGMQILPFINIMLFGILASVMFVKTGNIWMCSAVHSIWNLVQGNFYGIQVSGNGLMDSIFITKFITGKELFNGGSFGLEGGLAVTIVCILGTVALLFIPGNKLDTGKENV